MKIKLNVHERFICMNLLPKEGNFSTLRIQREAIQKLGLSNSEFKKFSIKQENDKVSWNEEGNKETELDIPSKAIDLIKESLKKLDETKKLEQNHFSIYEKLFEDAQQDK